MTFKDIEQRILDEIKKLLEMGVLEKDAGPMVGIGRMTYFRWKKEIPEFKNWCVNAVLDYKKNLVMAVNVNSVKDGKVAMEMLRTRWPGDYNIAKKIAIIDPEKELKKTLAILNGEEVDFGEEELGEEEEDVEDSTGGDTAVIAQLPPADTGQPQNQGK